MFLSSIGIQVLHISFTFIIIILTINILGKNSELFTKINIEKKSNIKNVDTMYDLWWSNIVRSSIYIILTIISFSIMTFSGLLETINERLYIGIILGCSLLIILGTIISSLFNMVNFLKYIKTINDLSTIIVERFTIKKDKKIKTVTSNQVKIKKASTLFTKFLKFLANYEPRFVDNHTIK